MARNQADIIIVGGGMVGLTVARALAETTLKILVIDSYPWSLPEKNSTPDLRVSAITRASQNIFRNLNCWQLIKNLGVSRYEKMHVWDATGNGAISFDAADLAEPDLGHIIENRHIRAGLWQSLDGFNNVTLLAPVKAEKAIWDNRGGRITLDNGDTWRAPLLIAADGANSWLRQQRKIKISAKPYGHDALVCNITTEHKHQKCAWQRFLETGPLALLPLENANQCSIVWSTSAEEAERLKSLSNQEFNHALTEAFDNRLGSLSVDSVRVSFPLIRRHVENYIDDGIALVGDAAHTIHPLAGQGVNLGLLDAVTLAEVIINALEKKQNIGNRRVLRPYERWRRSENQMMLQSMGSLKYIFDGDQSSLSSTRSFLSYSLRNSLRNKGMQVIDNLQLVKREIILRAMGLKGDLPLLTHAPRDPELDTSLN